MSDVCSVRVDPEICPEPTRPGRGGGGSHAGFSTPGSAPRGSGDRASQLRPEPPPRRWAGSSGSVPRCERAERLAHPTGRAGQRTPVPAAGNHLRPRRSAGWTSAIAPGPRAARASISVPAFPVAMHHGTCSLPAASASPAEMRPGRGGCAAWWEL